MKLKCSCYKATCEVNVQPKDDKDLEYFEEPECILGFAMFTIWRKI